MFAKPLRKYFRYPRRKISEQFGVSSDKEKWSKWVCQSFALFLVRELQYRLKCRNQGHTPRDHTSRDTLSRTLQLVMYRVQHQHLIQHQFLSRKVFQARLRVGIKENSLQRFYCVQNIWNDLPLYQFVLYCNRKKQCGRNFAELNWIWMEEAFLLWNVKIKF